MLNEPGLVVGAGAVVLPEVGPGARGLDPVVLAPSAGEWDVVRHGGRRMGALASSAAHLRLGPGVSGDQGTDLARYLVEPVTSVARGPLVRDERAPQPRLYPADRNMRGPFTGRPGRFGVLEQYWGVACAIGECVPGVGATTTYPPSPRVSARTWMRAPGGAASS